MARDRQVERVGEAAHGRRGRRVQRRLRHQPQQRRAVTGLERAQRARQVAVDREAPVRGLHDRRERRRADSDRDQLAVGVAAAAADRVDADAVNHAGERRARILDAARVALAHEREPAPGRLGEVAERRVRAGQRIGAVEHQRAQPVGVADRERLADVCAVGVAVEVDLVDLQRVEHGGEVVDHRVRSVEVALAPDLLCAAAGTVDVVDDRAAERRAVERVGEPRAALVDQQQVAPRHQRPQQLDVVRAAVGRGVARAALDGDHRPQRGPRAVAPPVALVLDPELLPAGLGAIQRNGHRAAAGGLRRVLARVCGGFGGRRERGEAQQGEQDGCTHRLTPTLTSPHARLCQPSAQWLGARGGARRPPRCGAGTRARAGRRGARRRRHGGRGSRGARRRARAPGRG